MLVEHAPVMIWRAGVDAKCDYFNETWLAFTGRSLEQELGDGWKRGVHPTDLDRCLEIYQEHFAQRELFEMEYRLRRHDGSYRYIFDRGVPYFDKGGSFAGFVGSCVDVQDRHDVERTKSMFLSMVVHELRTPLTALKAFLTIARRKVLQGESISDNLLRRTELQTTRLMGLVQDLADVTQLEQGTQLSLAMVDLDLAVLVRDLADTYETTLLARGDAKPSYTLTREVVDEPCPVRGDGPRLEQVFSSFLNNAVKYSPSGGDLRISLTSAEGAYVVRVSDPGIGIPEEEIPRVTRRYYRASNASARNYPGVGLGLSLAREIIERHGGTLTIESRLGAGTTVSCMLPVADRRWGEACEEGPACG